MNTLGSLEERNAYIGCPLHQQLPQQGLSHNAAQVHLSLLSKALSFL